MVFPQLSFHDILSIGIFGFVFGAFETTTNLVYLLSRNYTLSRKQHGFELPDVVTESEIRKKVIQMFCLGVFLLLAATFSLLVSPLLFIVGSGAIFVSSFIDYVRFRKSRTFLVWFVFSCIPLLLLVMGRVF